MATPKRKKSPSRRGMRRSHHALKGTNTTECKNCGAPKLPHHVCAACGHYEEMAVIVASSKEGSAAA